MKPFECYRIYSRLHVAPVLIIREDFTLTQKEKQNYNRRTIERTLLTIRFANFIKN